MKKIILFLACGISLFSFASEISKPFAEGIASNDLRWEARFNMPDCNNEGGKKNAFCLQSKDMKNAIDKSGVEAKLNSWIVDPKIKSLYLAYLSFSNAGVKKALCEGVENRKDLTLNIYINYDSYDSIVEYFSKCGDNKNVKIYSRGRGPFGTSGAYLQHSKIFLALETENLDQLGDVDQPGNRRIKFTSSSANMSAYGTNLHFENWIFFDAREDDYVARQNVCTFRALGEEQESQNKEYRGVFKKRYAECVDALNKSQNIVKRNDIKFYQVPMSSDEDYNLEKPYDGMKRAVLSAKQSVYVAIHRLMTRKITGALFVPIATNPAINFEIIYDDDTLRFGKEDGGAFFEMQPADYFNYRLLKGTADQVYFMETNARASGETGKPHLFHNKFIVVDDKYLFQGAGNFTDSSLNITNDGNIENFYLIEIPEIVKTYKAAWKLLSQRATKQKDHEVYKHKDRGMTYEN